MIGIQNDAENDKKILSLTPLQNAELIRQLVSSNPAAREAILALVPSVPSTPTQSRFFTSEVEKLAPSLSGGMWNGHSGCRSLLMDALDSTTGRMFVELRKVRNYHDDKSRWYEILNAVQRPEESKNTNYAVGSRDDYLLDTVIAILDIELLMSNFENSNRDDDTVFCLKCPSDHGLSDMACTRYCAPGHLAGLMHDILGTWNWGHTEAECVKAWTGDWILALLYESPDGSSHPFRSAVSRYIILPPVLPPRSPDDPWTVYDPLARSLKAELRKLLEPLPDLIIQGKLLATEPSPIPGLDKLSLSGANPALEESKMNWSA